MPPKRHRRPSHGRAPTTIRLGSKVYYRLPKASARMRWVMAYAVRRHGRTLAGLAAHDRGER